MKRILTYVVGSVLLLALGYAAGQDQPPPATAASSLAATATPEPTQPPPDPTPRTVVETVEVEVEVVPDSCYRALDLADAVIGENASFILDVLGAYVDYPDETLIDFGRRFEDLVDQYDVDSMSDTWDEYNSQRDSCLSH